MAGVTGLPDIAPSSSFTSDDSTIRVLLLGRSGSGKSSSGNTILGQKIFMSPKRYKEKVTRKSEEQTGDVSGRTVCVIDTPDLLDPDLSGDQLKEEKDKLVSLCQAGLHAVLLVLPIGEDLQNEEEMLEFTEELLGPDIKRYIIILFTRGDELEDDETIEQLIHEGATEMQQLVDKCKGHHVFNNVQPVQDQVDQLLIKIDGLVQRNWGPFLKRQRRRNSKGLPENFSEAPESLSDELKEPRGKEQRRLVLLGKSGVGKSATGNTILGRKVFASKASSSSQTTECSIENIERGGKEIIVIDTPGLYDTTLSQEEVTKEILKCMTYSCPGPHAFLIVIRIGRFTPEEKETVNQLKEALGANVEKYTMILFTCRDEIEKEKQTIEQYLEEGDPELKALVESCGNRFYCLNNNTPNSYKQFKDIMDKIDSIVAGNEGKFCSEAFLGLEQSIKEIQKEKMAEKIKNYNKEELSQSEWERPHRCLQKESQAEDEKVLYISKLLMKYVDNLDSLDREMMEAESKGTALSAAIHAIRKLTKQQMCRMQ